jgi:hypothetical protein
MPKFLEDKLKKKYGKKSATPYKIMNKFGLMRGNKETSKGARTEEKHYEEHIKGLGSVMEKKPMMPHKKKKKSFAEAMG